MRIFTVDTFTNEKFKGNQAAVCLLENEISDKLMLKIAKEINFSETAFVTKTENLTIFNLRWFTPKQEIDLCGHATLASAKIIYHLENNLKTADLSFLTKSGTLVTKLINDKIEMIFPSFQMIQQKSNHIFEQFSNSIPIYVGMYKNWVLVELSSEKEIMEIKPNFELLKSHSSEIFIFTSISSNPKYDFISRCFAPKVGINEDPVTGSAHCYLAPYWSKKLNKTILNAFQSSERTGEMRCEIINNDTVLIKGDSIIMSEIIQNWG